MPKLQCPNCDTIHDLSPIPDAGWFTVRDADRERFLEIEAAISENGVSNEMLNLHEVLTGLLYECDACGTLLWQKPGGGRVSALCAVSI